MTRSGKSTAAKFIHARALLLCDAGESGDPWKVADVAAALGVTPRTIEHLKQRFVEEGLEAALLRKPQSKPRAVSFDGAFDARLTALACSEAPAGTAARWDGAAAGGKAGGVEDCRSRLDNDRATVAKKNELQPHLSKYWKIPGPMATAAFVAAMEDVLAV